MQAGAQEHSPSKSHQLTANSQPPIVTSLIVSHTYGAALPGACHANKTTAQSTAKLRLRTVVTIWSPLTFHFHPLTLAYRKSSSTALTNELTWPDPATVAFTNT